MLKRRIVTALLLLLLVLPALLHSSSYIFSWITLLLTGLAAWEWGRLNGCRSATAAGLGLGLVLLLALFWFFGGLSASLRPLWWLGAVLWLVLGGVMLRRGVGGWAVWPLLPRLAGGLFLLALVWLALVQAQRIGYGFLFSVLALVWVADIAAFAGGKTFGRRKLAPCISPGKSWEGVFSGLLAVFLLAAVWLWADVAGLGDRSSLYTHLWALGPAPAVLVLLFLFGMSVVGDLLESLVKRSAGVKDSSRLLPGHGGVLDRFDSLLPVLPLAMLIASL